MNKYKIVNKMPIIALLAMFLVGCGSSDDGDNSGGPSGGGSSASLDSFAVLAGQAITNTGITTISGEIGLSPGASDPASTSIVGFPVGTVVHANDASAIQAQADLTAKYTNAANQTGGTVIDNAGELGGRTLPPGVYKSDPASSLNIASGTVLTLDGQGNANAAWTFQAGSSLTVNTGAKVVLTGGAQAKNISWQVTSSATLGTTSTTEGTIMALASITLNAGAVLHGRALARNGSVSLDSCTITTP